MRYFAALLLIVLLAACAQNANQVPNPIIDRPRNQPTVPAPDWVEAAQAISLETVPLVQLLGRLDNPLSPSTIFNHAFSPDGTLLAGLDNEQIVAWDLLNGETLFNVGRRAEINRVFFSADKSEVYALESTGVVSVHDAESGVVATTFRAIDNYDGQVAYFPEDGWLAFGNRSGQVRVWDPLERESLATIEAHPGSVLNQVVFSLDGNLLATAADDGMIAVWDWRTREEVARFDNERQALRLAFSPDATLLAAGTGEDIRLWSLVEDRFWHLLETGPRAIEAMAFSPDGRYLINGGQTPDMMVWNPDSGALVARLPGVGADRVSMAFSPDGDLLLTSVLGRGVTLWNLTTITDETVNNAPLDTGDTLILDVDWSADSHLLTLFGATGSVYLWGIPTVT